MLRAIARSLLRLNLTLPGFGMYGGGGRGYGRGSAFSRTTTGGAALPVMPGYTITGVYSGGRNGRGGRNKQSDLAGGRQTTSLGRANEQMTMLRMGEINIEDFRPMRVNLSRFAGGRNMPPSYARSGSFTRRGGLAYSSRRRGNNDELMGY